MAEVVLIMTDEAVAALHELKTITGCQTIAEFLRDAARTMEWILFNQTQGCAIVALPASLKEHVEKDPVLKDMEVNCLASYIEPGQESAVIDYFIKEHKEELPN